MKKYIWMEVTQDELELPLAVANSAGQLAIMLNENINNIVSSACKKANGKISRSRFVRIEEGEEDG